ncbi:MAG: lutA 3 [Firmicutes bacterium]|nr:lutA 3 [Bacillota bacterium]
MKKGDIMNPDIAKWQKQLVKCIRCGTCRSVCPIFQFEDNENTTARGKVKLLESVSDGKLDLTPALQERLFKCLMCKACAAGCPSGVKTDELFLNARKTLVKKNGLPLLKKIAFTGLRFRRFFDLGLRMGATFQNLVLKDAPGGRGKQPRIPIPAAGFDTRRIIPTMADKPLRRQLPSVNSVAAPKARVAFFTGCMLNYMYPEAGKALVRVLNHNGIEVVIPEEQCCCGTPAFTSGDQETGQFLAEHNINVLAAGNYDAIITGCATCGSALKLEYGEIISDATLQKKWEALSEKVYDITTYLLKIGYDTDFGPVKATVTYHDPCHLVRSMGVSKEPRQIMKNIPGLIFQEMKEADKCCGSGGTFNLAHYELSRKINDLKLNNAEATGAEILVTGCSACRMHIADGLNQRDSNMKVVHTAEIIDRAYQSAKKGGK